MTQFQATKWETLVDCSEENQCKTILSVGIGQLGNNLNPPDQSLQVMNKIIALLSTLEGDHEKKKAIAIHNAMRKVLCIETLHLNINQYLDFKSLMRSRCVNSEWLFNAYRPQSQYKFNTRQCHIEYVPARNDAAEPRRRHLTSLLRTRRKSKRNRN